MVVVLRRTAGRASVGHVNRLQPAGRADIAVLAKKIYERSILPVAALEARNGKHSWCSTVAAHRGRIW